MNNHSKTWSKSKFFISGIILATLCASAAYFFYFNGSVDSIVDFNPQRDTPFILDSFTRDWYWLVEGDDYSPEYMLKYRASSKRPEHVGNMIIKVGYHKNKPVGFVTYFMKNFYVGDLRFIDINPEFRSQGWAYKLLDYAVKDLIRHGAAKIELVTRTNNLSAQKLYARYGFRKSYQEDGFVYFEYLVPHN